MTKHFWVPEHVPAALHPDVQKLGPEINKTLEVLHLYRFHQFTEKLEHTAVNPVAIQIAHNGYRGLTLPKQMRQEAYLLYTDEASGISQWIFPDRVDTAPARRGGAQVVYYLPDDSPPEPAAPGTQRGGIIKGIRKVVRVISWYTDALLGHTIESFVAGWESRRRDYGWQMLPLTSREDLDWPTLGRGRCLLLLHGTFFFFASRRRHRRFALVSWARRCV